MIPRSAKKFWVLALLCGLSGLLLRAADKSGVSPNSISLPKGPGSIEGLGENFQPTLNTGTAKYSIALKLPPGVAGHAPSLHLVYDGGGVNGALGFGWDLPLPFVERQWDKGIPLYPSDELLELGDDWSARTNSFINDLKEELVPLVDGNFFCKNEGAFIRYQRTNDYWVAQRPDGTVLTFGRSPAARVAEGSKVFKWLLESEVDTHGNAILYTYASFPGDDSLNQKYLAGVSYGPGTPPWSNFHFLVFGYEDRPDWFEDGRAGFLIHTGKRLASITIGTQGPALAGHAVGDFNGDGTPDNLDRRYSLEYLQYAGVRSHWSLLARLTLTGADGVTSLPPSTFGYSVADPPESISASGRMIGGTNEPPSVMDSTLVDFLDLNGDGLPDILETSPGTSPHRAYINLGENSSHAIRWSDPVDVTGDPQAWSINLAAESGNIAHLSDMDGDGLADLVFKSSVNTVYFFRNTGHADWDQRQPMADQNDPPPSPFGGNDIRTGDLDLDKRMDIIQSENGERFRIWFNLGDNTYSRGIQIPGSNVMSFLDKHVELQDFNGDRVPDLVRIQSSEIIAMAGIGYGRFVAPRSVAIPDYVLSSEQLDRAKLQDITGDGLPDLVIERAVPGELWYWVNLGNYTLSPRKVIADMPQGVSEHAVVRWADINGNGSTDLVYADSSADSTNVPRLQSVDFGRLLYPQAPPNLLTAISNGIGRVTLIGYQPSTAFSIKDTDAGYPWPNPVPFPVQVVAAVTNQDSLGHAYITQFGYHDGFYDPVERQFRGFGRVEQIDVGDPTAPTLVTRSYFDTGRTNEVMKGKLLRLTGEQEDGKQFWDETTSWVTPPRILYSGTNGTNIVYAHPTGTLKVLKELGKGIERTLETESDYDTFGNQTFHADYGIVEGTNRLVGQDERITSTTYAVNTNLWLIREPSSMEVRGLTNPVISRKEFFYDDATFTGSNLGQVLRGDLTLTREWIDPANPTNFISRARTKYDGFGNPSLILDPLGSALGNSVNLGDGHARELAYDPVFHTYPAQETIHIGGTNEPLVFRAAYDPGFGTVSSSRDFNDVETTYGYDPLARLVNIVRPGDSADYPTVEYTYALAVPSDGTNLVNYVETRQLDKTPPTNGVAANVSGPSSPSAQLSTPGSLLASKRDYYFISRQFVDGLGRQLMTKTEAEPAPGSTAPRVAVSGATLFNRREKPAALLNPYFSSLVAADVRRLTNSFAPPPSPSDLDALLSFENVESSSWTGQFHDTGKLVTLSLTNAHISRTDYDATLREIKAINQDATFRTTVYEPLLTRSYDENDTDPASDDFDTPMVHYNDGLGRLVQVDEVVKLTDEGYPTNKISAWDTHYEYDLNDQLTRIIDSQQNEKYFHYDGLKRKIWMNDPDRGVMTFIYDDASNLRETIDAKEQHIQYTYDGANRILTENYLDGKPGTIWRSSSLSVLSAPRSSLPPDAIDVLYHYDYPVPNVDQGDTTIGTANLTRGKLAWVEDLSGEEHTSYDCRGRVASVLKRIPDPLLLNFARTNSPGVPQPQLLVSYKTSFQYDSADRITRLIYPDNDEISHEYNDRTLLSRIVGGPTGSILTNLTYQPSGAQNNITYGNGVITDYSYDPRLRLKELFTRRPTDATGAGTSLRTSNLAPRTPELVHFGYDFDPISNIRTIHDLRPAADAPESDPRRNTQIFQYDSLYRITRAQYSFNLPSAPIRNDGVINYRYDRIGNMLVQTSTFTNEFERGLPAVDLGQMDSGGTLGRFGRHGRSPSDPPGPHALTLITQPGRPQTLNLKSSTKLRSYPYDQNGNMEEIDGLHCTWDSRDRLIAVEDDNLRAEYAYDYTDRRISKRVLQKRSRNAISNLVNPGQPLTTLYINKYFEVRENDAPTKYIWDAETRVADVTGSLSANSRLQRLRVYRGWNLVSTALTAPNTLRIAGSQFSTVDPSSVYKWDATSDSWKPISSGEPLTSGSVLWLVARTDTMLTLTGTYTDPTSTILAGVSDFLPSAGLEVRRLESAISNLGFGIFSAYDPTAIRWFSALTPQLDGPAFIPPGGSVFVRAGAQLSALDSDLRIRYYHQDHLGSTSHFTSASGEALEETANYPFGMARYRSGSANQRYSYTQKERDPESSLEYFEARFFSARISRFLSSDPLLNDESSLIGMTKRLNAFGYAFGNPLALRDPTGFDAEAVVASICLIPAPPIKMVCAAKDYGELLIPTIFDVAAATRDYVNAQSQTDPNARDILERDAYSQFREAGKDFALRTGKFVGQKLVEKTAEKAIKAAARGFKLEKVVDEATKKIDQGLKKVAKSATGMSGKSLQKIHRLKDSRELGRLALEAAEGAPGEGLRHGIEHAAKDSSGKAEEQPPSKRP